MVYVTTNANDQFTTEINEKTCLFFIFLAPRAPDQFFDLQSYETLHSRPTIEAASIALMNKANSELLNRPMPLRHQPVV